MLGLLGVLSLILGGDRPQAQPLTNVVLILADDLGWSDLGCYGADLHETPALDRLASGSVRFTQAYAASVCSPTRATLLTGRHYARLGISTWRESAPVPPKDKKLLPPMSVADLPWREITLAEVFQSAGYRTALVGKWHLGNATHYPETQGFDVNVGGTLWGAPHSYFYPYRAKGSQRFDGELRYVPHLENGQEGEYLTDRLTEEALRFIDQSGEKPFFLYLAHHAPHSPIQAKADKVAKYQSKVSPTGHHQNATYAAMVESLDESVGRVLDRLQERGLADRTLVIFLSDNGGHIGQFAGQRVNNNHPLRSGKGSMYEGGIRVPLLIRAPGIQGGTTTDEPVYVADLYPTLLEWTGLSDEKLWAEKGEKRVLDGLSLGPILRDPKGRLEREALYFHFPHYYPTTDPVGAIRERDWKLIEYFEGPKVELYHLSEDPTETTDLAVQDPVRARQMQERLSAWRTEVRAPMPTPNPAFR
jgi:arylsulfatase A-like enzyme